MSAEEIQDIVPQLAPLLGSNVTVPDIPHLWDEFQGVQDAAVRAALVGTPLDALTKQYKDRFEKASRFIDERTKIHRDAVDAESKRLQELAVLLEKRLIELEAAIAPLRESLPAANKAFVEAGEEVNALRRKTRAAHLQFQFEREDEVTQRRITRRLPPESVQNGSWIASLWPFRRRRAAEPLEPFEIKQPNLEDADVPPELVDQVNAAWKRYSLAQIDWSAQDSEYRRISAELDGVRSQIIDTRTRCGCLDNYRVQILDYHEGVKLKLSIEYEQIQAALLDAYVLAQASKSARNASN